jgi:hypothetical protein
LVLDETEKSFYDDDDAANEYPDMTKRDERKEVENFWESTCWFLVSYIVARRRY